jgi:hypothetical protein
MPFIDNMSSDAVIEIDESSGSIFSLDEKGGQEDIHQENMQYSGLVQYVIDEYTRSKNKRRNDEERWLTAYKNYRGLYNQTGQFTSTEKSQAYIKITKTKVLAAHAQIVDVLFAGNKFPLGVQHSPVPDGISEKVNFDPKSPDNMKGGDPASRSATVSRPEILQLTKKIEKEIEPIADKVRLGSGNTPTAITWEPAKEAARAMEKMIHDQLEESGVAKELRHTMFEMPLFGTGAFKGPFATEKEYPKWNSDGEYEPLFKTIPEAKSVSIWNLYPDADARGMDDCEKMIERHRMNRSQMRKLKKRPFFRKESIEKAINLGPNYIKEYWEDDLIDNGVEYGNPERWEVLEYWGIMDRDLAEDAGLELPKEYKDREEVQINLWVCQGQILRLVLNPFNPERIPYYIVPYELNPYSFFGIGVAENMQDTQLLMNGFMRLAVDNAALSSNVILEVDEGNLVPNQDMSIYPGKIFRRQAGAPGQAIFSTKVQNVTNECLLMFDKARQLSDEATGLPSYSHGMSGVMNVGRTASGMSMLMGAADRNIKSVVRNVDDYLLAPMGKNYFAFNMQFNFNNEFIIGDLEVVAKGTESLMRNEVRSQKLLQFLQITANPLDAPFVKRDYALRELAASLDLDEDELVHDIKQATIQAEMYKALGVTPETMGGQPNQQPEGDPTQTGGGQGPVPSNINTPGEAGNTDPTQSEQGQMNVQA